jgi:hypothetical protein
MKYKIFTFFVSIFCVSLVVQSEFAAGKDYSKLGGEYALLNNLRFNAKKVEYTGKEKLVLFGREYTASKFIVSARITVQTSDNGTFSGTFENADAFYELLVGLDESNEIHDAMLKSIYDFWSTKPKDSISTSDYQFTLKKNGDYLMFAPPIGFDRQYYLVWVDGKFIKASFREFGKNQGGWGALSGLWSNVLKFRIGKSKIEPEFMVDEFPEQFLQLFKQGKIKLKNSN